MPDSDTGRGRLGNTAKKDTSPAAKKGKVQNGHLKSSGVHLEVPVVSVGTEKPLQGSQPTAQQANTISNNVSVSITLQLIVDITSSIYQLVTFFNTTLVSI